MFGGEDDGDEGVWGGGWERESLKELGERLFGRWPQALTLLMGDGGRKPDYEGMLSSPRV